MKPSLMNADDDEDVTGETDVYEVYDEFRKRFLSGSPEESMDALMGMCELAKRAHGEDDEGYGKGKGKPSLAIEIGT